MATSICPWWASTILKIPVRKIIHNPKQILFPYIAEGSLALDIGCGPGYFSLPMAELVGNSGTLIAADLQPEMLEQLQQAKSYPALRDRIVPHCCSPQSLALEVWQGKVDTALLMMVLHEIPDKGRLIEEIFNALRSGGKCLFAEPVVHVGHRNFSESLLLFEKAGFKKQACAKINFCRSALLVKP